MPTNTGYPDLLAKGLTAYDFPAGFDLFAGESDIVTDQIETGGTDLEQFRVYALDELGLAVPWNPDAGAATGTVTFAGATGGAANDTVTINGHVITLKAGGAAGQQINLGADAAGTAANLKAYIDEHPDETGVRATRAGAVVTLKAFFPGIAGNSITLAETSATANDIVVSGATLAGGAEESEGKAVGLTAQAIVANSKGPAYVGGIFNHEALVWPATVTTLRQRKAAFARTNVGVRKLL